MTNRNGARNTNQTPDRTSGYRALTLDVALYQSYLDDSDLTEDQKREFIEAVWSMMVSFVDLGYEIRPENSCEQIPENNALRELAERSVVQSANTTTTFNISADIANDQREREET